MKLKRSEVLFLNMEFAFKIDRHVKANLYKICRLCGIENPDMIKILKTANENKEYDEDEPELSAKILVCLGIEVRFYVKLFENINFVISGYCKR